MTKFDCTDSYSIDIALEKIIILAHFLHCSAFVESLPVDFIAVLIVEDETRHISPFSSSLYHHTSKLPNLFKV